MDYSGCVRAGTDTTVITIVFGKKHVGMLSSTTVMRLKIITQVKLGIKQLYGETEINRSFSIHTIKIKQTGLFISNLHTSPVPTNSNIKVGTSGNFLSFARLIALT